MQQNTYQNLLLEQGSNVLKNSYTMELYKYQNIVHTSFHFDSEEKYNKFKERIAQFDEVTNLKDAKALANKILPVSSEITRFTIGNATCTVVNRNNLLRISLDSDKEFISYNFE